MKCKLCLRKVDLLKKSHIIPDFMHKEIFDEKHRMIKFTTQTPNSETSVPSSEYESNVLCKKCDNEVIGNLETYVSRVLFGGRVRVATKNYIKPDGLEFTQVSGLDYKKFKLFLLSLLWRASISSRSFFGNVNLGPYEDEIREMILKGDPFMSGDFPCIITSYRKHNLPKEIVAEPKKIRLNTNIGYNFLIGGFMYIFKIIKNDKTKWILEAAVNKNGEVKIIHTPKKQAADLLAGYFGVRFEDHPDYKD
ncbi:hypothetical protein BMS3Abin15_00376 [bacterium BMS3Abin15]|nr:hypothetical protein BMS3Abin15_00376 [bacterium BMS3Abin15]